MEQRLVSTVGVCGDQLYEELGLCVFCCGGIVDWSLCVDDAAAEGEGEECSWGCVEFVPFSEIEERVPV